MPVVARAQQNERIRRIGVLSGSAVDDQDNNVRLAAFQHGCSNWAGPTATTCGLIVASPKGMPTAITNMQRN